MGTVISFTGEIHSGKSTAARLLHDVAGGDGRHFEFSDEIIGVANEWLGNSAPQPAEADFGSLGRLLEERGGVTLTDDALQRVATDGLLYLKARREMPARERLITPTTKDTHREGLQWLGFSAMKHIKPDFWSDVIRRRVQEVQDRVDLVTLSSRTEPDGHMVHSLGGKIVLVRRPNGPRSAVQSHVVEQGMPLELIDATVANNVPLSGLRQKMAVLWEDVTNGGLRPNY